MVYRNETYSGMIARLFPFTASDGRVASRTLVFQVCEDCNLRCSYCYQTHKSKARMEFETAKMFIDLILSDECEYINTSNTQSIIIEFVGGEPFLAVDLVEQITDYFIHQMVTLHHPWATRFHLSISSNGTLYMDDRVQRYITKHNKHLSFGISVDGNKELHDACRVFPDGSGSYDLAIAGVDHYATHHKPFRRSKMTIAPENLQYLKDAVIGLIDSGYKEINLNCIFEPVWNIDHAKLLYQQLKDLADYLIDHDLCNSVFISMLNSVIGCPMLESNDMNYCGGLGYMLALAPNGDIFPCIRYMRSSLGDDAEPVVIGTAKDGIMVTQKQKDFVTTMKCVTRRSQSTDKCFNCPIATGCAWCSAQCYQQVGAFNVRTTNTCLMHQATCLANVYYWNKAFAKDGINKAFENNVPKDWALDIITNDEYSMLNSLIRKVP